MSKQVYIYALRCPIDGEVRYVGASVNPEHRLKQHMYEGNAGRAKKKWLRRMKEAGLRPQLEILEVVSEADRSDAENHWIHVFKLRGCNLVNAVYRGCRSWLYRPDTRAAWESRMRRKFGRA